ncbi:hypothetical protein BFP70_16275 [Thioclava sp. SK-1]|uniref:hypothetical protein n=1 Tax=Thioclava sp. SK-1 TaxID=1889770 RepID=UPI000825F4CB|nr:hypothetical protein [Thioclava sp. SK-1]OCX61012.1 hypothetical protein BFP70_16275 [Thioclava sp. SK-1]
MTKTIVAAAALTFVTLLGSTAYAGSIDRACKAAGRADTSGLCSCIQQVADMTLSGRDQSRAAKFFRNPDEAQQVRMSDRPSDEDFWKRYKNFADAAQGYCS